MARRPSKQFLFWSNKNRNAGIKKDQNESNRSFEKSDRDNKPGYNILGTAKRPYTSWRISTNTIEKKYFFFIMKKSRGDVNDQKRKFSK